MTEQMTEPTREDVERLARMALDLSTLMGAAAATETAPDDTERRDKLLRSTGYHAEVAATLRALLSRAEQTEAERDAQAQYAANLRQASTNALEDQRAAEAERDAARAEAAKMRETFRLIIRNWPDTSPAKCARAALAAAPEVSND